MMRAPRRRRPKEAPKRAKPMRPGVGRYTRAQEQRWENAISSCLRLHPRRHFPTVVPGVGRYTRAREQRWENAIA